MNRGVFFFKTILLAEISKWNSARGKAVRNGVYPAKNYVTYWKVAWGFLFLSFHEIEWRTIVNQNPLYSCVVDKYIDIKNQESQKFSLQLDAHDTLSCENWEPAYLFLTYLLDFLFIYFFFVCCDIL